jgi:hypothetical protein
MDHYCYSSWLDPVPQVDKNDPQIKKKNEETCCFEVLDVIFSGLEACSLDVL